MHRFDNIVLYVIDAVDLAVSKVARFSERDREEIRALAQLGLVDMEVFARCVLYLNFDVNLGILGIPNLLKIH